MALSAGFSVENSFVNGLVTEATGLNFPENAVTETDNCVFDQDGTVRRRNGIDRENGFSTLSDSRINLAVSEYVWDSVAGNGNLTFLVQQTGSVLRFFSAGDTEALSAAYVSFLNLSGFATDGVKFEQNIFQYSAGFGKLIVSNPFGTPVYISFDESSRAFSANPITILTRDFKGVQPHPIGRSSSITESHRYNLLNQGWDSNKIAGMQQRSGLYPSDYDVWWLYKTPDAFGTEVFLTDVAYAAGILNQVDRGNSPAPKGSYILDEFYQDRSGISGVSGIPVVTSGTPRPATNAFHAGRVFFAGVYSEEFNSKVYFSQIIEGPEQFPRCYQQNDPTSQYTPDLLPSDGGVISIPEAGSIYKLWSVDNNLLVFASTGVWQITGSSGIGFSATDYTVKKISSIKSISANSFVSVNGSPLWWGLDAIYAAVTDSTGQISISPISDERIKTFYADIPEQAKVYAKGAFNSKDKIVQWLYRNQTANNLSEQYTYTRILNLNTVTQAFYPWTLPTVGGKLKGIVSLQGLGSELIEVSVTNNSLVVVTDNLSQVVSAQDARPAQISSHFKYLVQFDANFTYGGEVEGDCGDWASFFSGTSVIAEATFVTGYKLRGNGIKKSQSNYLRIYNEGSGTFIFQSRWDYANSASSGRWSAWQMVVFGGPVFDYLTRRLKIRGHGLAFQYSVQSSGREPFAIIGWASFDTANERP